MNLKVILSMVNMRPSTKNITKIRRKGIDNSKIIIYDKNKSAIDENGYLHCFSVEEMNSEDWEIIE